MNTNPDMLEYVVRKLQEARGTWPQISRVTFVSYSGIQKMAQGVITNPTYSTVKTLYDYFQKKDAI